MSNVEFFLFDNEIWYKKPDGITEQLKEQSREVVKWMYERIESLYPIAFGKLKELYRESQSNIFYFQFRIVDRFCRCNFGAIDNVPDISNNECFKVEHVSCPLRGICKEEGVICNPKFDSKISEAEKRILEPLFRGETKEGIADKLCLSLHTINNHIRNAYTRIGVHSEAGFMRYANEHELFKL